MAAATADGSGSSGSNGQFYPPTVIVGVTPNMDLYHEEVFGPVSFFCVSLSLFCFFLFPALQQGFLRLESAAQLSRLGSFAPPAATSLTPA
jgi:hypothetical protein